MCKIKYQNCRLNFISSLFSTYHQNCTQMIDNTIYCEMQLVIDPCSDYYTIAYMNRPDVQNSLHANVTNIKYSNWQPCRYFQRIYPCLSTPLVLENISF